MNYQNIFKRYELKYLITKEEKKALFEIMKEYMEPDEYGKSTINNIYFDTPDKLLIRRSLDKPVFKEKLRIRSYGATSPESTVFIEIKRKYDDIVYKRRIGVCEKVAMDYLIEGIPLINKSQISKEIDSFMDFYREIEPSIFLSYEREAFYSKTDENFRMTFDERILTRGYDLSLTSGNYGESNIPEGMVVLEIKTVLGVPKWLLDFLSENKIYKTSFSKYGNAYMKLMLPRFLKKIEYYNRGGDEDVA